VLVHELFARTCAERGSHPAVVDAEGTLSYADLARVTRRCAHWLRAHGVGAGDRVVFAGASDRRFLALFYATSSLGAVFVPVHPDLTAAQLGYIAGNCRARLVLADTGPLPSVPGAAVAPAPVTPVAQVWHEACATDDNLDTGGEGRTVSGQGAAASGQAPAASDQDTVLLIYTSGTTGHPKGVVCPHRTVLTAARSINECLGYRPEDVVLCRLPLSFDYGLYQALLCALVGATLVLADRGQDRNLLNLLCRHRVTVVPLVPSLAQMLSLLQRHHPRRTAVRLFTNTGARLGRETAAELLQHFPDAAYASMYGMTECKRISVLDVAEYAAHPDSVGRPIPGDFVRVDGPDGTPAPPYTVGEIVVWGATVMAGYWGVALADQARYRPRTDGSLELHTGDQGYLDDDGRLYFVGRNDDMIKRRGIRISLTEIENAAELVPGVHAAVALRPRTEDGPLHLAVHATVPAEEVRRALTGLLDRSRMPDQVTVIAAVPLTPNGKPDRDAVQRQLSTPAHQPFPTPQTRQTHEPARV